MLSTAAISSGYNLELTDTGCCWYDLRLVALRVKWSRVICTGLSWAGTHISEALNGSISKSVCAMTRRLHKGFQHCCSGGQKVMDSNSLNRSLNSCLRCSFSRVFPSAIFFTCFCEACTSQRSLPLQPQWQSQQRRWREYR